jgi:predicted kinase
VAEAVARELHIPVFCKDWLEGSLLQAGMKFSADSSPSLGYFGYELLTTLALQQLRLSQSVILDSVASTATIRDTWRALAAEYAARWRVIECICSDESIHRARLVTRERGIPAGTS